MAQRLKEEVRKQIEDKALEIFSKKGYKKTTIASISAASGVPVGNIYNYFKSKAVLLDHLMKPVTTLFKEHFLQFPHNSSRAPGEILNEILEKRIDFLTVYSREMAFLFQGAEGSKYENMKEQFMNLFLENMLEYRERYEMKNPLEKEEVFFLKMIYSNFINCIIEILKHGETKERIRVLLIRLIGYHRRGIEGISKQEM